MESNLIISGHHFAGTEANIIVFIVLLSLGVIGFICGVLATRRAIPILNVQEFGASEDNEDNTNAVQMALNVGSKLGGAKIYFPPGVYRLQESLDCGSNNIISGDNSSNNRNTDDKA